MTSSHSDPPRPAVAVDRDPGHDDFGGLQRDLGALVPRRRALAILGGVGAAGLLSACSRQSGPGAEIPDETAGPFPSDGTNGPNLLTEEGVVRNDLTASIGSLSGTAEGVATTISLTVIDAETDSPIPGAAVYLWHCTADGRYSIYEIEDQNYLRGVAAADDDGRLDVTTVFPGCYRGRWPHAHFEVFDSLAEATDGAAARKISQLAIPRADCEVVYGADDRYGDSVDNLSRLSLESDGVFRDGSTDQLATASGSVDEGYTLSLVVRV